MIYYVKYVSWKKLEIPDEIIKEQDEEEIIQHVFNAFPDCLTVKEIIDANDNTIVKNW